jgi:hypothetical protein
MTGLFCWAWCLLADFWQEQNTTSLYSNSLCVSVGWILISHLNFRCSIPAERMHFLVCSYLMNFFSVSTSGCIRVQHADNNQPRKKLPCTLGRGKVNCQVPNIHNTNKAWQKNEFLESGHLMGALVLLQLIQCLEKITLIVITLALAKKRIL